MSYDEVTAARVRRVLVRRRGVVEQRMVGGLSFLVNDRMCCGVTGKRLMIRVGPVARDRLLARRHVVAMKLGGRTLAGFVCVTPEGFRTDRALQSWVQRGIDFVATLSKTRQR